MLTGTCPCRHDLQGVHSKEMTRKVSYGEKNTNKIIIITILSYLLYL